MSIPAKEDEDGSFIVDGKPNRQLFDGGRKEVLPRTFKLGNETEDDYRDRDCYNDLCLHLLREAAMGALMQAAMGSLMPVATCSSKDPEGFSLVGLFRHFGWAFKDDSGSRALALLTPLINDHFQSFPDGPVFAVQTSISAIDRFYALPSQEDWAEGFARACLKKLGNEGLFAEDGCGARAIKYLSKLSSSSSSSSEE
jgi:hypothetical protein